MNSVILRKDARELGPSAIVLTLIGVAGLAAAKAFMNPYDLDKAAAIVFCLAWMCGLVTAVQPFAQEAESGTLAWLDALPVTRRQLWRAKALAAGLTTLAQVIGLLAAFYALGLRSEDGFAVNLFWTLIAAAHGFVSGICGSALARTSLGAVGWAALIQFVGPHILLVLGVALVLEPLTYAGAKESLRLAFDLLLSLALPLAASRWLFTRPDRNRTIVSRSTVGPRSEWAAVAWLAWRQTRWIWVTALVFGGLGALPLLALGLWPLVGTVLGVVLGIAAFGSDRFGDAYRFLGERRLPIGRVWLVKTALAAVPLVAAVGMIVLYGFLRVRHLMSQGAGQYQFPEHVRFYDAQAAAFGPLLGFAIGLFAGMVSRKAAVALVLGLSAAEVTMFVWWPSFLMGGVHWWQWPLPAVLLIASTRLFARPRAVWAAGSSAARSSGWSSWRRSASSPGSRTGFSKCRSTATRSMSPRSRRVCRRSSRTRRVAPSPPATSSSATTSRRSPSRLNGRKPCGRLTTSVSARRICKRRRRRSPRATGPRRRENSTAGSTPSWPENG